jgi:nitrite reductase/ring-hydroxylating ferredoxin subunit
MPEKPEDRVDRIVKDLLRGRRLRLRGGDAEEKEAITAAARLAAATHGPQRMNPEFRNRLASALESAPKEPWLSRRAALVAGLGVAAGAVAGGFVGRALEAGTTSTVAQSAQAVVPWPGRWVDVGAMNEFVDGQGKRVSAGGVGAFVFRRGDTVTAVSSICSHLPCELQWNGGSSALDCPCHPVSFDSAGKPTNATYPMQSLNPVNVRVTSVGRVEVLGT